jgi:hypothetical protein
MVAALALGALSGFADEKKDDAPQIVAIKPLRVLVGEKQIVRLRGVKLKDATAVQATPPLDVKVKEKKDAAVPTGSEAKDVGDQELAIELTVPADFSPKTISIEAIAPAGRTAAREIGVIAKDDEVREREPNNGFREAQPWNNAKPITGSIESDKDVDVFKIDTQAEKPLTIRVIAASAGSLLDPVLTLFDADGHLLATADDADATRDALLGFVPKIDGPVFLVVSDANDRSTAWHEYRLEVQP